MENKTSKYFKYAIGEIILVVIGILIALQINNWNEERKNKASEKRYLINLTKDLENQIANNENNLEFETKKLNQIAEVIDIFNTNNGFPETEETLRKIQNITTGRSFKIFTSTFSELKSTGNLSLIRDKELLEKINQYYIYLYNYKEVFDENAEQVYEYQLTSTMEYSLFKSSNLEMLTVKKDTINYSSAFKKYKEQTFNSKRLNKTAFKNLQNPENELKITNAINFKQTMAIFNIKRIEEVTRYSKQVKEAINEYLAQ